MKQRWPIWQAQQLAEHLQERLAPFCERIEIAGSIRRQRETVGDIELVLIPRSELRNGEGDFFPVPERVNLADEAINAMLADGTITKREGEGGTTAWGPKNKLAVHTETGIPVDFFSTTAENWIVAFTIRTGGKETNLKLTTGAQAKGMTLMAYGSGFKRLSDGAMFVPTTDRELFQMAGVEYAEPKDRK